jgi:hypothetical protein
VEQTDYTVNKVAWRFFLQQWDNLNVSHQSVGEKLWDTFKLSHCLLRIGTSALRRFKPMQNDLVITVMNGPREPDKLYI